VDEGGLTKEFFHLAVTELFEPKYGMFEQKHARFQWFEKRSFESAQTF